MSITTHDEERLFHSHYDAMKEALYSIDQEAHNEWLYLDADWDGVTWHSYSGPEMTATDMIVVRAERHESIVYEIRDADTDEVYESFKTRAAAEKSLQDAE